MKQSKKNKINWLDCTTRCMCDKLEPAPASKAACSPSAPTCSTGLLTRQLLAFVSGHLGANMLVQSFPNSVDFRFGHLA